MKKLKPLTLAFLIVVAITLLVWILRGLGILSFMPGFVIWLLIFLSVGTGIMSNLQGSRWR